MTATVELLRWVVATALVVVGAFFLTVGTVGLLRLPNVYNRMHATSKATTLGAASLVVYLAMAVLGYRLLVGFAPRLLRNS